MNIQIDRRRFIKQAGITGLGLSLSAGLAPLWGQESTVKPVKVGIIGLDTEHSIAFTKVLNDPEAQSDVSGFRVVAAYPYGSRDIEFSIQSIPKYTAAIKKEGVEIVTSIEALLERVEVVLLETNDGRLHLEQALPVIKAGKPLFIDKPMAASLADALLIFKAAEANGVPVFSASSLRFMQSAQAVVGGKLGKVLGADTFGPADREKTHPDLFWYGIHGIETLFTLMGPGCRQVTRSTTEGADLVVGVWDDQRIGTFRGIRAGQSDFGGTAFGEEGIAVLGPWEGYRPLVAEIVKFFRSGNVPVQMAETVEIFAFMEAAQESKRKNGQPVFLSDMIKKAEKVNQKRSIGRHQPYRSS